MNRIVGSTIIILSIIGIISVLLTLFNFNNVSYASCIIFLLPYLFHVPNFGTLEKLENPEKWDLSGSVNQCILR